MDGLNETEGGQRQTGVAKSQVPNTTRHMLDIQHMTSIKEDKCSTLINLLRQPDNGKGPKIEKACM